MAILLGFDFGTHRIGVAVGQTLTCSATPLTTVHNRNDRPDWGALERIVAEWQPTGAILGLPLHMDEREAELAARVRRFARQLHGRFGLTTHLIDERLSTRAARERLAVAGAGRFGVDAVAAQLILETWLGERH